MIYLYLAIVIVGGTFLIYLAMRQEARERKERIEFNRWLNEEKKHK